MTIRRGLSQQDLPGTVPVFAVPGAILLAGGTLPLAVFEPRYLSLVDDCLGERRLLALVQPSDQQDVPVPGLYGVGTLGRITAFGETGDGRYLITVSGICRFRVAGESEGFSGYRRVIADYSPFIGDLDGFDKGPIDRRALLGIVQTYLAGLGMGTDLAQLEKAEDADLAIRLSMACPFSPPEKQALLEAPTHAERCRLMTALIQKELLSDTGGSTIH